MTNQNYRVTTKGLVIHNFLPITEHLLSQIGDTEVCSYMDFDYILEVNNHELMQFCVKPLDYSRIDVARNIVKIKSRKNGGVAVFCDCGKRAKKGKLCEHAFGLFCFIYFSGRKDYLRYLTPTAKKEIQSEIAKDNEIEIEMVEKYIDYEITREGISAFLKKSAEGLIFDSKWNQGEITEMVDSIKMNNMPNRFIPALIQDEDIGFSIILNLREWNEMIVHPLTAKMNKKHTALSSKFKIYHPRYGESYLPYEYENHYPELFYYLEKFKVRTDSWSNLEVNISDTFLMLKKIFALSKSLPFPIYQLTGKEGLGKIPRNDITKIKLSSERVAVKFKVTQKDELYCLFPILMINEKEIVLNNENTQAIYINRYLIKHNNTLHLFKDIRQQEAMASLPSAGKIMVTEHNWKNLYSEIIVPLMQFHEVDLSEIQEKNITKTVRLLQRQIFLQEQDGYVVFVPKVLYEDNVTIELLSRVAIKDSNDGLIAIERDIELENNFIDLIEALHPDFAEQRELGVYYLEFGKMLKGHWFLTAFEELRAHGIKILGANNLTRFKYSTHTASVSTGVSSGEDWFDIDIQVSFGDYTLSISNLKKMAKENNRYVELSDGSIGILPKEWLDKLQRMFKYSDSATKDGIKISKMKFSLIDELFEELDEEKLIEEIAQKKQKLLSFKKISDIDVPKQIKGDLRIYQKEGLNWLNFLDENNWGGILADDMGLGKTIQILSFLQRKINEKPESTHLIVMPTTLIFNWENEIKKFTEDIKVDFHIGTERAKKTTKFNKFNIIITTYGVLLRDIDILKNFRFGYVVLDESQAIKNPHSKRYKSAMLLNADNKIALTGTPIENNTFDLYAQMNFVNPGLLGSQLSFKEDYSLPIDRDRDEHAARDLHKMIKPFLLRRTKEQVAQDLPEKIEDILYCEMEGEQLKVYEAFRNKYRDFLLGKFEEDGLNKSKIHVLEGLTKLRQICDSPRLLPGDEVYTDESAKIKTLLNHIEEKTNNHKILIFSQFVKMLELVKEELLRRGIMFEYLDGKRTGRQRKESVNNFQENDRVRVFLISLKAGGTGINLTAADYVYLLDPWWNPAVENQAIDRTHRIGQDKNVIAYRMICKNTIEEKIMNIKSRKKKIASDIIQTEENILKTLSKDDIMNLFK